MFPDVAMGAQRSMGAGGAVGNEEREKSGTREMKNTRGKECEVWKGWWTGVQGE